MLVEVTCPACRHRGHISHDMLPRSLKCSRCGQRARFEARRDRQRPAPSHATTTPSQCLPRPSLVERVQVPDDLARLLWDEHG
jgi:hypothetical protein